MFTDEDKSLYDKTITSISEQQIEGNESFPTDMPSQKESGKRDSKEQEKGRPTGELGTGGQTPAASWEALTSPHGARGLDYAVFF